MTYYSYHLTLYQDSSLSLQPAARQHFSPAEGTTPLAAAIPALPPVTARHMIPNHHTEADTPWQTHMLSLLSTTALLLTTGIATDAQAQYAPSNTQNSITEAICREPGCKTQTRGKALDNSSSGITNIVPSRHNVKSTEHESLRNTRSSPFSITIDGENLPNGRDPKEIIPYKSGRLGIESRAAPVDKQRQADLDLHAAEIQVKYDGGDVDTLLNVSTVPIKRSYRAGEVIRFLPSSNYPDFIVRSEIRIYRRGKRDIQRPVAVIPAPLNRETTWIMPSEGSMIGDRDPLLRNPHDFLYVLRVYDEKGRFDETLPLSLVRTSQNFAPAAEDSEATAPGFGDDRTGMRNIPIQGGAVTVYGRHVPQGYTPHVFGQTVPLDNQQQFVVQRILPPGEHMINVSLQGGPGDKESGLYVQRSVNIPDNDWFYVGLADISLGKRMGAAAIEQVRPGEYDKVYKKGRLAFYLKGKVKGQYLLTAAADTTEDDLKNIFKNMDKKDARRLLRRLDPDDYYPVYGDDSSFTEDAPTKGRFYVRLERGDSHILWGTSNTRIVGTELLHSERQLYGVNALYRSQDITSFGERRTEATAYGSQPESLSQRQEFLATGGSAYFMKRQDIVRGSETVTVETRQETTGRIIERRTLRYGEDYSFDYMQGVLLLQRPLNSTTGTNEAVHDGALGGQKIYVLTNYEYIPTVGDVRGYSYGGRLQQWLGDTIRVGFTGMSETTGPADQKSYGADVLLRASERTMLEGEVAQTKGPGFGLLRSTDGGLTSWSPSEGGKTLNKDKKALSWRVAGRLGLSDMLGRSAGDSSVGGYYQEKQAGYSSLSEDITRNRIIWGADTSLTLSNALGLRLTYDNFKEDGHRLRRDGSGTLTFRLGDLWSADLGLRYTKISDPQSVTKGYNGNRLDAGARLQYRPNDDMRVYIFGQKTLKTEDDISKNDRGGIGAELRLTDKTSFTGEASYGTHGLGALATIDYNQTADDHYYVGYRLDPDRAFTLDRSYSLHGTDMGAVVAGMRRRINDVASAYAENTYDLFGRRHSLTHTYGVNYTPNNLWAFNGGLELGRVRGAGLDESRQQDFDRFAPSFGVNYKNEPCGINAMARTEMRIENSKDKSRNQISYLFSGGLGIRTTKDWRFIANLDAAVADTRGNHNASFTNTDYVETSLGYAYRPIENDRMNALFKYTWLYDMPGTHQRVGGDSSGRDKYGGYYAPAQNTHIVSADFTYDLYSWLSVGGKYGLRLGRVKYRQNKNQGTDFASWQKSTAHLGVLRADLHWIKNWDLLMEGRVMYMPQANATDYGILAAVYRHLGDNFKLGIGYNFGRFSDDLRDQTYNDRGMFVNFIGKF